MLFRCCYLGLLFFWWFHYWICHEALALDCQWQLFLEQQNYMIFLWFLFWLSKYELLLMIFRFEFASWNFLFIGTSVEILVGQFMGCREYEYGFEFLRIHKLVLSSWVLHIFLSGFSRVTQSNCYLARKQGFWLSYFYLWNLSNLLGSK